MTFVITLLKKFDCHLSSNTSTLSPAAHSAVPGASPLHPSSVLRLSYVFVAVLFMLTAYCFRLKTDG